MDDKINAFDAQFSTNHLKMLKLLLPHLAPAAQSRLALYIKWEEFRYTLYLFKKNDAAPFPDPREPDSDTLCRQLLPYCTEKEKENIDRIRHTMQQLNEAKEMMEMVGTLKELFPEGLSGFSEEGAGDMMSEIIGQFMHKEPKQ